MRLSVQIFVIRSVHTIQLFENFCVRDGICWCSHDPVFASNYFVTSSKNFNNSCFRNFMPTSPQLDPAVAAVL